jgi:hypothetical protein
MVDIESVEKHNEKKMIPFVFSEAAGDIHIDFHHKPTPWSKDDA